MALGLLIKGQNSSSLLNRFEPLGPTAAHQRVAVQVEEEAAAAAAAADNALLGREQRRTHELQKILIQVPAREQTNKHKKRIE